MLQLSYAQKRQFFEEGFLVVRGAIPDVLVKSARKRINHSMGAEGVDPERLAKFKTLSFCPEVQQSEEIVNLVMRTPVWDYAQSFVGEDTMNPITGGQIALRFPTFLDPPPPARPHLDGMYAPGNGVPEGTIQNFTMLVGVLLSDLPEQNAGNFTVWPRTHRQFEEYYREHTPEDLLKGMPGVEMPEPHQITGKAGDVVFVHYQTAHTAMYNLSDSIRYAIFFRLYRKEHGLFCRECMLDIWKEWDGMREIVAELAPERATT
jgi:hypothetical protein